MKVMIMPATIFLPLSTPCRKKHVKNLYTFQNRVKKMGISYRDTIKIERMRPIVKIEECFSNETYTKEISVLGIRVKTIVKTDRRSERKENPIGFQTMNNILDHYPDV